MKNYLPLALRGPRLLAVGAGLLFLLLLGPGAAHGQPTTTFGVRVTPAGPVQLPAGGSQVLTAAAFYPAFDQTTSFDGPVNALVAQADGKILVGGDFSNYQYRLARLNPDGTADASFRTLQLARSSVRALALQPDGKILVGFTFTLRNGLRYGSVIRLNPDGSQDGSFTAATKSGTSLDDVVTSLAVQADGKVLVAGSLTPYDATPVDNVTPVNHLLRLNADGSRDASFTPPALNARVNTVVALPTGKVLVGGAFTAVQGAPREGVARFNADGSLDTGFTPPVPDTRFTRVINYLVALPDGRVLAGGSRTFITGQTLSYLVRLNAAGDRDADFSYAAGSSSGTVNSLAVQADGQVLAGGFFVVDNGATPYSYLLRLNPNGSLSRAFAPAGSSSSVVGNAVLPQPNGRILLGGSFANNIIRLNGDGSQDLTDTPITGATYAWNTGAPGPTLTVNAPGTYVATATLNGRSATSNAVVVSGGDALRLNAGGGSVPTSRGPFAADQYFSASSRTAGTSAVIAGTADQALYQSERYSTNGALRYAVPVANGQYTVVLHFAEIYWTRPGQRVFDVALEGKPRLTNYDIVAKVGPLTATTETLPVTVTDGVLNVDLTVPYRTGGRDQAKVSAIEVLSAPATTTTAVARLNLGGPAVGTTRGDFAADKYPNVNSATYTSGYAIPIANTADPALYRSERYSTNGALRLAFDVGNGNYTVVLHFAEIYWSQVGQRVFDVSVEGEQKLTNYDIVLDAGPLTAVTKTFPVTVTDGVLNVDLTVPYLTGGRDQAKLSAIEILTSSSSGGSVASKVLPAQQAVAAKVGAVRELSVYPNPAAAHFTLSCSAAQAQRATLTLTDQLGRVVRQQAVALQPGLNQVPVAAPGLSAGLYQLTLQLADGQHLHQRVLLRP